MSPSSSSPPDAVAITRKSESNLALAFVALSPRRRRDITIFYAFCRIIDDIADEPGPDALEKKHQLDAWRRWIAGPEAGEPPLAADLREVIARYGIDPERFHEILAGVEMDLHPRLYETFEDLRIYCHRVASAVGLVSIEIFGYRHPETRRYALDLGMALQLTNIIRDVGADLDNGGRIYLPMEDLRKFRYTEQDLRDRVRDERLDALLRFEASRARLFYHSAQAHLTREDRPAMIAARMMNAVYATLLRRMEADGFRVLEVEYRLNRVVKAMIVGKFLLGHWLARKTPPVEPAPTNSP